VEAKGNVIGDRWELSNNSVLAKKIQVRGAIPNLYAFGHNCWVYWFLCDEFCVEYEMKLGVWVVWCCSLRPLP